MPLPLAALIAFAVGALFAHVARVELAQSDAPLVSSRAMAVAAAYAAFVWVPAMAYFAAFHGDWAYMYFVAWRRVPSAIDLAVVLGCAVLVPGGFLATAPLARAKRRELVLAMMVAPVALAAVLAVVFEHRLGTSATFAQFKNDFDTQPVARSALGRAVLVAIATGAAATLWSVRLLRSNPSAPGPAAKIDGSKRWR